jgi:ATP-dependent DNA helicase RecG
MEIKKLINSGESETVEFKKSTGEWKEIIETLSAFANTRGGIILVGIDKKKKVCGVSVGKGTIEDLTNKIVNNTEPKIYPEIGIHSLNKKKIIYIKVETYPYDVVLAFGKPFKRVGKNTVRMSKDEYKRRILEIHKRELYFDGQICPEAGLSDIDERKVREFLRKAKNKRKLDIDETLSLEEILRKLKLMREESLTNACILLFGKNPQDFFIQAGVKCIRFKGIDITADMLDFKDAEGDIFEQLEETENFIFRNIGLRAWLEDRKLERQEKWEYPPKAIREALVNAIVHRDYRSRGKVQVRIYDDRIEFWNPGRLPSGWTPETLKGEHTSEPFNPLIFKMFFWTGEVDDIGSGTNKIINWCKEWGLPEPEFGISGTSIFVRIRKDILTEEYLKELGLNERQIKAVMYVKKEGKITNKEYQIMFRVSKPTATRDLSGLVKKQIFNMVGSGKRDMHYILSKPKMSQKIIDEPKISQKLDNEGK